MPKISIILPTYKPDAYIEECIQSISNQSFKDYELIIVLNGCNEPYYSYVLSLLSKFDIFEKSKLIQTYEGGVSKARNIGLDNASGEYITFIDDDDYISHNYLENLIRVVGTDSIAVSNIYRFLPSGEITDYTISKSFDDLANNGFTSLYDSRKLLNGPWMKLYPINVIKSCRFDTDISLGEDALFNFQISCNVTKLSPTSADTIYYYRVRGASSWKTKSKITLIKQLCRLLYKYNIIYLKNISRYNTILFLSRIAAIIINFGKPILCGNKNIK